MSLIRRIRRLWELSGTLSDAEDEKFASTLKEERKFFTVKAKKQRLATVIPEDPLDVFPSEESPDDKTS